MCLSKVESKKSLTIADIWNLKHGQELLLHRDRDGFTLHARVTVANHPVHGSDMVFVKIEEVIKRGVLNETSIGEEILVKDPSELQFVE
jgi:hypothetical protein